MVPKISVWTLPRIFIPAPCTIRTFGIYGSSKPTRGYQVVPSARRSSALYHRLHASSSSGLTVAMTMNRSSCPSRHSPGLCPIAVNVRRVPDMESNVTHEITINTLYTPKACRVQCCPAWQAAGDGGVPTTVGHGDSPMGRGGELHGAIARF